MVPVYSEDARRLPAPVDVALPAMGPAVSLGSFPVPSIRRTAVRALSASLQPGFLSLLIAAFGGLQAGCGARSGLRVPCSTHLEREHPEVVLVLDRSASMAHGATPDSPMPWQTLLDTMASVLPQTEADLDVGALYFPWGGVVQNDPTCAVQSALGADIARGSSAAILGYLVSAGSPAGNTPTYDALQVARSALEGDATSHDRFIVLGTDGGPTCNADITPDQCDCFGFQPMYCYGRPGGGQNSNACSDSARTVAEIQGLADEGIHTVVVGIITADAATANRFETVLNAMAVAGGEPVSAGPHRYYRAESSAEIQQAFENVLLPLSLCRLQLPTGTPVPAGDVAVVANDGTPIPMDATHQDGWDWSNRAMGQLAVYGASCGHLVDTRGTAAMVDNDARCTSGD